MSDLIRQCRNNKETGTVICVEDTHHPDSDLDPFGGRWATVCERHGMVVNHDTLKLARSHAANPTGWCEPCEKQANP